jgi:phosphoribosylformylglycinamidine synthase
MAMAGGIGVRLRAAPADIVPHAWWVGEDQARYLVTMPSDQASVVLLKMKAVGVPCAVIGTTGGASINIEDGISVSIEALRTAFERWLPDYMAGKN